MVINWTNPAIIDLKEFKKITQKNNANEYIINLVNATNMLIENPRSGKIYTYINKIIIRQLIYKEHRIFYYLDNDTINIISVNKLPRRKQRGILVYVLLKNN